MHRYASCEAGGRKGKPRGGSKATRGSSSKPVTRTTPERGKGKGCGDGSSSSSSTGNGRGRGRGRGRGKGRGKAGNTQKGRGGRYSTTNGFDPPCTRSGVKAFFLEI
ncbi:hypothetical protein R5R35_010483 [Gryllus longicercus]|uniref:Uncharacterized protein n=1 Tax=Gryllus longicercus TaxID=2509291 RepID=A0AAN9YTK4_9ORTH